MSYNTLTDMAEDVADAIRSASGVTGRIAVQDYPDRIRSILGAPIPEGFVVSSNQNERCVEEGLVVLDGVGNEFVWVPVPNINDMIIPNGAGLGKNAGQLYNFTTNPPSKSPLSYTVNSGTREPDYLTFAGIPGILQGTDVDITNRQLAGLSDTSTIEEFQELLQKDFNEMVESVRKYKGFYIGRYETSLSEDGIAQSMKGKPAMTAATTAGNTWYGMYAKQKALYSNSNNVVSGMIWGCQWDQVMLWMKDIDKPNMPGTKYILDSTGMGNYSSSAINTGSNSDYKVKNIYDMAGNLNEWTLEASGNNTRATRRR